MCGALLGVWLGGCSLIPDADERLARDQRQALMPTRGAPIDAPVIVHWNAQMVPFIEAQSDADAAFVLGMVHAHLRLAQMELLRRVSQGRLAEVVGPLVTDIDHALRILDFSRSSDAMLDLMSEDTRLWTQRFVDGINHYQDRVERLPPEFGLLGLEPRRWSVRDVLTFSRLAGTDVNWLIWARLWPLRERADWPRLWRTLVENGSESMPSFEAGTAVAGLAGLLLGSGRAGSNAMAIGGARSASGGALLASDPHLGISLPNPWLIAGLKSPGYHMVGLMIPGLPFVALGRNPDIAWGGTNMRAASSDLVDVSELDPAALQVRSERIGVRWWFDRQARIRVSEYGPVLSDAPLFESTGGRTLALQWIGHRPSDEIGAMLQAARASDFPGFRRAFERFAVSGQNMLYADRRGNIGQLMAVTLPSRAGRTPDDLVSTPRRIERDWQSLLTSAELPFAYNPDAGFLVSANNKPAETPVPVGYFFSADDRVQRMREVLRGETRVDVPLLAGLQQDVLMPSAVRLKSVFLELLRAHDGPPASSAPALIDSLRRWDGRYSESSEGAVAFELFKDGFARGFYAERFDERAVEVLLGASQFARLLIADLNEASPAEVEAGLGAGVQRWLQGRESFSSWGQMHRLRLAHPLGMLPLIGERFRFEDLPVGGSSHTLMKTAHDSSAERHYTRFGSNARHISDLSDPDANYFVLLGGQDGWLNAAGFLDQLPLWRSGRYVQVPLRLERVRELFTERMVIEPGR
ncbi:MAG: penicillin acylase family protein [Gammaproteobacteria bacterium]|nr:penicillin acylase family protein [Gammaproteobacteria bacterium]